MKTLNALKAEMLADPATRAAYDALAPEFETARELIAARARAGLTQQEVAERMGTTQSTVARLEGGKRPPLLPGFVSKWLIGSAAIETGTTLGMIGVAALLISAVLTAIYLMGPAMSMYFRPLEGMEPTAKCDPGMRMKLPFAVLAAAIVLCGLFSDPIITLLAKLSAGVM